MAFFFAIMGLGAYVVGWLLTFYGEPPPTLHQPTLGIIWYVPSPPADNSMTWVVYRHLSIATQIAVPSLRTITFFIPLLLCCGAFLLVAGLRQSLGRARVRVARILRVSVYSWLGVHTTFIGLLAVFVLIASVNLRFFEYMHLLLLPTLVILLVIHIRFGWGTYLRLPHAWPVAILSVFVSGLLLFLIPLLLTIWMAP